MGRAAISNFDSSGSSANAGDWAMDSRLNRGYAVGHDAAAQDASNIDAIHPA